MSRAKGVWRVAHTTILVIAFSALSWGVGGQAFSASGTLADRLLVEINTTIYTQRQMEVYLLTKSIFGSGSISRLDDSNWNEQSDRFVEDMILDQEAQKGQSFTPAADAVEDLTQKVKSAFAENAEIRSEMNRLGLNPDNKSKSISRAVTACLRVNAFRQQREKRQQGIFAQQAKKNETSKGDSPDAPQNWIKDLKDQYIVRYYKEARVFRRINPQPTL